MFHCLIHRQQHKRNFQGIEVSVASVRFMFSEMSCQDRKGSNDHGVKQVSCRIPMYKVWGKISITYQEHTSRHKNWNTLLESPIKLQLTLKHNNLEFPSVYCEYVLLPLPLIEKHFGPMIEQNQVRHQCGGDVCNPLWARSFYAYLRSGEK